MKNLQDLFEHELKDLYSAKKQILDIMPKMIENSSSDKLVSQLEKHKDEINQHLSSVKSMCDELNIDPEGVKCNAMKGLVEECESMIKHDAPKAVKDAGLIACQQRVEHYQISGYGTATKYARTLGHDEIANRLDDILDQESRSNEELNDLAIQEINPRAMQD